MNDQTKPADDLKGITQRLNESVNRIQAALNDLYVPAQGNLTAVENAMLMSILLDHAHKVSQFLHLSLVNHEKIDFRKNADLNPDEAGNLARSDNPDDRIGAVMLSMAVNANQSAINAKLLLREIYKREYPDTPD